MRLLILSFLFLRLNVYAQDSELIIRQGHKKAINVVTYSVDGQYVLSAGEDKVIKMWDVKTGIDIKTFSGHTAPINCLELTNDGKQYDQWGIRMEIFLFGRSVAIPNRL